tara:strand:- start:146 stop:1549 length:1404 start_codon:yes stop_codon:yes gene_type:complete
MKLVSKILFFLITINFSFANSKPVPDSFADLADKLMPSVVNISTTQTVRTTTNQLPFQFPPGSPFGEMFKDFERPTERKASSLGSGFIIDTKGVVVTNNHVISGADDILVRVGDKEYKARVIGADPYMDIAVLKMDTKDQFKPVNFGDSDKARVGDWAVAIGNPFGLGGTVTAGIISARNRDINLTRYDDFIQTDASINQGNSGGPLFNLKGEVIGINTAIIAPGQSGSIGIGFAIPANAAANVIDQLIKFGETKRGWLGVRIQEVTKEIAEVEKLKKPQGALVASVGENSPADKAGIKAGDIILDFDGKKIDTMRTLPKVVASTEVGKSVELKIWRNKKLISKRLTLGRLESSEEFREKKSKVIRKVEDIQKLKIAVRDITNEDIAKRNLDKKTSGVVVTEISSRSPLNNLINVNDIIIEVQKTPVKTSSDLKRLVDNIFKKGEKTLLLTVINQNNQRRYLGVKIN